jgi:hypothetical protein
MWPQVAGWRRGTGLARGVAAGSILAIVAGCTAAGSGGTPVSVPSAQASPPPSVDSSLGTGIVARLPMPQWASFSWSPDGAYLLIANSSGSRVYDRHGAATSSFAGDVGWLDASSVIDTSGSIRPIRGGNATGYVANTGVVASGHGAAAIIVARPACEGDPLVDWYRDGAYRRTGEQVTPFGWSADGRYIVEGHLTCSSMDAELHGWKGKVDVVDFASGKTLATMPDVRGEMAFNPSGTRLAAQSDSEVEIADLGGGAVVVAKGVRLLGWTTDHTLALRSGETLEVAELLGGLQVTTPEPSEMLIPSPVDGIALGIDVHGKAIEVRSPRGSLLGLRGADLTIDANPEPAADEHQSTRLAAAYWSPDGRMLALPTADGLSIALISVDPDRPAAPSPYASNSSPSS